MDKSRDFIHIRAAARARGDTGLVRAMTAELERLGDPRAFETTAVAMPEQAVPAKRRGRPPRPRCEHGKIVGRCVECDDELAA